MPVTVHPAPANGTSSAAGVLADRPAAAAGNSGDLYFATDVNGGTLYRSNGTSWVQVAFGVSEVSSTPLFLDTQRFGAGAGTPSQAAVGGAANKRISSWALPDGADVSVVGIFTIPWASVAVEVYMENNTATPGDVVMQLDSFAITDGVVPASAFEDLATPVTITMPAMNTVKVASLGPLSATPGTPMRLEVKRRGGDALDTLAATAQFIGLRLSPS